MGGDRLPLREPDRGRRLRAGARAFRHTESRRQQSNPHSSRIRIGVKLRRLAAALAGDARKHLRRPQTGVGFCRKRVVENHVGRGTGFDKREEIALAQLPVEQPRRVRPSAVFQQAIGRAVA